MAEYCRVCEKEITPYIGLVFCSRDCETRYRAQANEFTQCLKDTVLDRIGEAVINADPSSLKTVIKKLLIEYHCVLLKRAAMGFLSPTDRTPYPPD